MIMRLGGTLSLCLLLVCCARIRVTQAPAPPAPPPAAVPSAPAAPPSAALTESAAESEDRADEAEEAAAFYLLKRAPDGRNLPAERYLAARETARRMPRYSSARRSFGSGLGP